MGSITEGFKSMSESILSAAKEKHKLDREKNEKQTKLLNIQDSVIKMRDRMVNSGQDTSTIDPFLEGISQVKDADVAEAFFKSALSSMEKQKSMAEKVIELSTLAKAGKDIGNRKLYESASEAANTMLGEENTTTSKPEVPVTTTPKTSSDSTIIEQAPTNQKSQIEMAQQGPMSSNVTLEGIGAIEIDNFTGKETADGQRQKVANSLIEERAKKGFEPLGNEVVAKYAGAVQGLSMIQKTVENLGFYKDASTGKIQSYDSSFGKKIAGSKAASFKEMTLPLTNVKVTGGVTEGLIQMAGTDDARKIDLWLQTLAEDVLRARTGAAAPEPERVREEARSLIRILDSPDVAFERLSVNEKFMRTVANQIRPGTINELQLPEGILMEDPETGARALVSKDRKKIIKEF